MPWQQPADHGDPPIPNTHSTFWWNTTLRLAHPHRALSLYARSMLRSPAAPNKFTFTFLIKACLKASTPHLARHLHSHLTKFGFSSDPFLLSALITSYAHMADIPTVRKLYQLGSGGDVVVQTACLSAYLKCGLFDDAHQVFREMSEPNSVTWAAVISGYSQSGRDTEALAMFWKMRLALVVPTEACLVSVLSSSARLGDLEAGRWVHGHIGIGNNVGLTAKIGTALVTMYTKCGYIEDAVKIFDEMPLRDRHAWTAMISGLAAHGRGGEALRLFGEMVCEGLRPDHVTYVGVLCACSHAGLVLEARDNFDQMINVYNIVPGLEHFGCMVDVLGRGGHIEDAWKLVRSMPMDPDEFILKSLLSACCTFGYMDYAEWAAEKLMSIDAGNASSYVLLSNAFARVGQWEDNARVRKVMRDRGVPKVPGQSIVN